MNQITTFQREKRQGPLRTLQVIFTWLAFMFIVLGSVIIGFTWVGSGNISLFGVSVVTSPDYEYEGKFLSLFLFTLATLFVVWLLSTIALALAKQWIAAVLALPAALALFIAFYLFLVFIMPLSGTIFVLLLILVDGVALLLVLLFLKQTSFYKQNREKIDAR